MKKFIILILIVAFSRMYYQKNTLDSNIETQTQKEFQSFQIPIFKQRVLKRIFFVMVESIVVKCTQELKPNFLRETVQMQKWMETTMEYLVKGIQDFKVSFSSLVVL